MLNRRCDVRSPSGILHCPTQRRAGGARLPRATRRTNRRPVDGPKTWAVLQGAAVGPISIGPALRAGSSSTTTGRQAPLLDTHPSPRCGRRGLFRPCRAWRGGISSQRFRNPFRAPQNLSTGQPWRHGWGPFGNFFRRTNMRAPTSSRHGRRKPLSRPAAMAFPLVLGVCVASVPAGLRP